ncbi:epididymal-specific lipocalin-6 [Dugong dugon]
MRAVLLVALLVLVSVLRAQAMWLGRLDPKQLLGPWYILAVASREKGFVEEKAVRSIEGVVVTLTPENKLKILASRSGPPHSSMLPPFPLSHQASAGLGALDPSGLGFWWDPGLGHTLVQQLTALCQLGQLGQLEGCKLTVVELLKQSSGWVFENPSLGVLEYRVLSTNFKDYAIVFSQLEFGDEAFNTVELYSRTKVASPKATSLFSKWSRNLGYLAQQQARLQGDCECGSGQSRGTWDTPQPR